MVAMKHFYQLDALVLQVVLAANDLPSINDVTYPELIQIISKVVEQFCVCVCIYIFVYHIYHS